ncbi:MAG: L-glutamate gamma-semialdehyde dehydrogenase [Reyranella sp.]|uniref:L-glutamate gamma-semialdehyde dehydrogenase n=1 Tax=Reyranella sp. TaxID=1929291 RepID=UPI001ACF09F3|nr:L-glutamate gamma-semialdehyde dehydrogenase [Reyranella sp.]MBN9088105.1 L-glutamate gamma-semialdehyde dehydrogenase [Reyranella sp.]
MSLRHAITAAYRRPEPECLPPLLAAAALPAETMARATALARRLVERQRAKGPGYGVEGLIHEYSLASEEGVALMCLAEALLRIPDDETRDALIRDKIGGGDWQAHLGHSPSLFVNAATWGLLLTGRLTSTHSERGLTSALTRLVAKGGEPLIRAGVNIAMRLMGEQFVSGQTIGEALANGRPWVRKGFRYSYDMLGEAAVTMAQADRYVAEYEKAIRAIGAESAGCGIYEGPGISIKLSALHPRYTRSQLERVQAELYPRLKVLAVLARSVDIGLNIDAEEADRLEISLDLLERLCFEPELAGWHGIGFVVQAYQKRCPHVIDWLVDLAGRSGHRLMVRLVKGAYWDGEIKRAQLDGLEGFPVFTRKIHTDVSYIACAAKLLAATDRVFPQFATHNALTLATLYGIAPKGQYEFQCLHGMGESLYEEVVGRDRLDVPCRIYAPVGTHETLLAYLVRRLLENGANTSFVNQIADPDVPIDKLLADPVERARMLQPVGRPHDRIALPRALFEERVNSTGFDISNEHRLAELSAAMAAVPTVEVAGVEVDDACRNARPWTASPAERAACLTRIADVLEARRLELIPTIVHEAGKTYANAVGEVREAADFLRYYAAQVRDWRNDTHVPLGIVACISPWNFPLSIFTGQIAGALAAGNGVVAKPAEETPKIAVQAVALFRGAGLPAEVLQLVIGDGEVGATLVANPAIEGVVFTGSTQAAQSINRTLAKRPVVPFIAETGGQNVMVVDSSALPEQLVNDALTSAFDSAGQRCSALRVLALQEDIAGHVLPMLKEAMAELSVGDPALLSTDVGPVITAEAQQRLLDHIAAMRAKGRRVTQTPAPAGLFVPPTLIEIDSIAELPGEVFGPVMHVLRYPREGLDRVIREANATGFGLTFGVHSRIDETIDRATETNAAGNQYVNRTVIGAVVGVQPFGGHGLSGTGPKAGGPLYVRRLLAEVPPLPLEGLARELPGSVGERNSYRLRPKGTILCVADDPAELQAQVETVRATGNRVTQDVDDPHIGAALFAGSREALLALARHLAEREGPIVPLHLAPWRREALVDEISLSVNTAAAGGNASLMTIG